MDNIILKPYITEKSSDQMALKKYVFLTSMGVNKIDISNYLRHKYDVSIDSIKTINKKSKKVRRGKYPGSTKSFKKIIVTFKSDKNIDKIKELF